MSDGEDWCKAQRLAVAGAVAPVLRSQSERARARRVARVDKDGNVVGYTTLAEVQAALLKARELEIAVADGVRPKVVACQNCGKDVPVVRPGGVLPTMCETPGGCFRQAKCARDGCGSRPTKNSFKPHVVRSRNGDPWVCQKCLASERMSALRKDPRARERNLAGVRSHNQRPDVAEARREMLRKRNQDPEFRAKVSAGQKNRFATDPDARRRQAEICEDLRARPRRKASPS